MKIFNETLSSTEHIDEDLVSGHILTMKLLENLKELDMTIRNGFHYNDVMSCIVKYLFFYQAKQPYLVS